MSNPDGVIERRLSEERVCGVADALREGDEVIVGERSRPLTVESRDKDLGINMLGHQTGTDYPYELVWLSGNGTRYRLRYSHLGEYYPTLHTEGDLKTITYQGEERIQADGRGETVRFVTFADVETEQELADRVLSRLIEVRERAE